VLQYNSENEVIAPVELLSRSPEQTEAFGRALAARLQPGDVVAYTGDLGAGKTALTRGIAAGLGVVEQVTSPTYTIVNEYRSGRLPLFHFDLYRLHSEEELFEIGWEDYLAQGGVCAVEWSENVPEILGNALHISISRAPGGDNDRRIVWEGDARFEDLGL
jgi:tRNA threonylcarbamoyladenosine biosynthesis protein TsaE